MIRGPISLFLPLFAPSNHSFNFIHQWKVEHEGKDTLNFNCICQSVPALINYFDHKFSSMGSCKRFEEGELEYNSRDKLFRDGSIKNFY